MRRIIPGCLLFSQESGSEEEEGAEQSKDSATRNDYAADIIKRGLNKEGWKLVITGKTGVSISHPLPHTRSAIFASARMFCGFSCWFLLQHPVLCYCKCNCIDMRNSFTHLLRGYGFRFPQIF